MCWFSAEAQWVRMNSVSIFRSLELQTQGFISFHFMDNGVALSVPPHCLQGRDYFMDFVYLCINQGPSMNLITYSTGITGEPL